ncbi:MAG TPA: hypothetical protein VHL77_07135 [Ferruginibacter sp.]|jgi:uncharacterized protein YkwD|nr:hypothetical protein [Ferruginibacter sp.]
MRSFFTAILLLSTISLFSQARYASTTVVSPLSSYSNEWNNIKYSACNTAANIPYLGKNEKEVIYILNLVRAYPALFANTVLKKYPAASGNDYLATDSFYFLTLVNTLEKMEAVELLYPDKACFESARCHAIQSGRTGYVGHERKTKDCKAKKHFYAECAEYGHSDPLEIVLALLIDEGIPSLGHRYACLGEFSLLGVSIQPHSKYNVNTVLDLH